MDYNSQPGGYGAPAGYAGSTVSAPPPGLNNQNYPPAPPQSQVNINMGGGGGAAGGGCAGCMMRNNPFEKANSITEDVYYNAQYKRCMGVSIFIIVTSVIAAIFLSSQGCIFVNIPALFHLFPLFMPSCGNRSASPFVWAVISMSSIAGSIVSFFLSIAGGCALEGAIIYGLVIVAEFLLLFFLYRMDPDLKSKVRYCFASCGCLGQSAQMETMVPKGTNYPTTMPPGQQGYGGASVAGSGLGNMTGTIVGGNPPAGYNQSTLGSNYNPPQGGGYANSTLGSNAGGGYNNNTLGSNPGGYNSHTLGSNSGYPPQGGGAMTSSQNSRNSAGKGSFYMDAPDEFDTGSRPGH